VLDQISFSSSDEVFSWLGQFVNMEQGSRPPSMRAERMEIMARAAGNPEKSAPAIHVAGSKGKGSVTAMASAMLAEAGKCVARYLSPHVVEYRERISLNNDFFDESVYIRAGNNLRQVTEKITNASSKEYEALKTVSDGNPLPTFFELLTLYYFLCAKEAGADALAVETGMGGRLDPTNIVQSLVSVITVIELEHTDILGSTIEKIAREKAGIIKKNHPLILAEQTHQDGRDALEVFVKRAREQNAKLYYFPDIVVLKNISVTKNGTNWTLVDKTKEFFALPLEFSIRLSGEIQAKNTSLAALAVKKAFPDISAETIQRAAATVSLPARFENISGLFADSKGTPPPVDIIVDGAHTALSVKLCVETWLSLYGEGGLLIFGCTEGKDSESMARILLPYFSKIIITRPGTYKPSDPERIFAIFKSIAGQNSEKIEFIRDTESAVHYAIKTACEKKLPVLGTGSFYLAAEIRNYVGIGCNRAK
jgi:dihydrofolate synthase/folylpolyglutamate synthase